MNDIEVLEDCLKDNQEMLDGQVFGDEMEKSTKLEQQALRNSITAMKENAKLRQDVDGLEGNCRWLKNKNKKLEAELSQCKQTIAEYVEHGKEAVSIEELKQHLPNIFAISMLKKFNISSKEADK